MNKTIIDPAFGSMEFDYGWCKEEEIALFQRQILVEILAEADTGQPISDKQQRSYQRFCSDLGSLSESALESLKAYYIENLPAIALQVDNPEDIPEEESLCYKDLTRLVFPKTIFFRQDGVSAILCDCAWEPQFGLAIIIEENCDISVDTQDEVL